MDVWLDSQGLYRKNTALDGTCLFRAVADQLFSYHVPNGHVVLREQCVKFMRENRHLFENKVISGPFDEYLDNLSDLKQWAGQLELEALSLIYGVDFLVFKSIDLAPIPATQNGFERKIMLCFTPDNFYDAVYPKSYIENAGFCQSIVYGILYRGVFKLEDLEYAVEKMLHDKSARARREKYLNSQSQGREDSVYDNYLEDSSGHVNVKEILDKGGILFPYKVAKALDMDIYRNIEFDNWVDGLRAPKKNSFCFGNGGPLRVGVKCLLRKDDKLYTAHVQEMSPDNGPVLVFVEDLGVKMTVPYDSLELLPRTSIKPEWTFSHKHQIINKIRELSISDDSANKNKGKNKNKKTKPGMKYMPMIENRKKDLDHAGNVDGAELNRQSHDNRSRSSHSGSASTIVAEPDSTTASYSTSPMGSSTQGYYGNNVFLHSYGYAGHSPQPQVVRTVNLAVNKSVKPDFTDLPLGDLETVRFFYNLGIDYFRMGCVVWPPSPPVEDHAAARPNVPTMGARMIQKTSEDTSKGKTIKNQKKAPRFMKMDNAEIKNADKPRNNNAEECCAMETSPEYQPQQQQQQQQQQQLQHSHYQQVQPNQQPQQQQQQPQQLPMAAPQIPVAIPYPPQYTVQFQVQNPPYPVQGYSVPPIPEAVPVEQQPMPAITYTEHAQQYVESTTFTVPYFVYTQHQFYYPN